MTTTETELEKEKRDQKALAGTRTTGGQIQRLQPQTFGELERLSQILAKSDIVPKDLIGKPANVLLVLMFGNEVGLTVAQALQNVMVVNGRPSLWGDAVMGLVLASDVYEDSRDEYDPKTRTATFRAKRKGKDWVVRTFSMEDAKTAGLDKKPGPWQQYPTRMLFHRARSWALRDSFADVLKGIRYYEEERDVIDLKREGGDGRTYSMPAPKPGEQPEPPAESPAKLPVPEAEVVQETVAEAVAKSDFPKVTVLVKTVSKTEIGPAKVPVTKVKTTWSNEGKDVERLFWVEFLEQKDGGRVDDIAKSDVFRAAMKDGTKVTVEYAPVSDKDWVQSVKPA
jgi:hypothetical protein